MNPDLERHIKEVSKRSPEAIEAYLRNMMEVLYGMQRQFIMLEEILKLEQSRNSGKSIKEMVDSNFR
jgi:hypothetical protein